MVTSLRSKWAAGQGGGGEASGFAPLGEKQSEDASPTLLSRRADFRRQRYLRKSLADNLPPEFGNHGSGKERNILQSFVCRSVAPNRGQLDPEAFRLPPRHMLRTQKSDLN
jgi:hypothetical protein